jgi:hypothetical protein
MRCAEITCASKGTPNCFSMAHRVLHHVPVGTEPMITPTSGFVLHRVISGLQLFAGQAFDGFEVLGLGFSITSAAVPAPAAVFFQSVSVSR